MTTLTSKRPPPAACPRCRRPLPPLGGLVVAGVPAALYQCESCVRPVTGADPADRFDVPVTFYVDARGRCVDPVDPAVDLAEGAVG